MDLCALSARELGTHVRAALQTPSGRVLREFLRVQCFMRPASGPPQWTGHEQVEFRYGRMTLFQQLEYYEDPANFPKDTFSDDAPEPLARRSHRQPEQGAHGP